MESAEAEMAAILFSIWSLSEQIGIAVSSQKVTSMKLVVMPLDVILERRFSFSSTAYHRFKTTEKAKLNTTSAKGIPARQPFLDHTTPLRNSVENHVFR